MTPFEQLLNVLPPLCRKLLPTNYMHLMISDESPIIDYYPLKVTIETTNIDMFWKAVPILSIVDINRIKRSIEGLELSAKEKYRNGFFDNFFNY